MFQATKTLLFFLAVIVVSSYGFSTQNRIVSHRTSKHTTLNMMWDTKKMGGASSTIEQKKVPVEEEETIKDFFRRTPPGSGADDRFPTFPKEQEIELENAKLSRIDQSLRQKTLMMSLEGNHFGKVDKLTLISQAIHEGTLAPSTTKTVSMSAGGLFKDWDMTM